MVYFSVFKKIMPSTQYTVSPEDVVDHTHVFYLLSIDIAEEAETTGSITGAYKRCSKVASLKSQFMCPPPPNKTESRTSL